MDFKILNLLFRCSKEFSHAKIQTKDLSDTECMLCSYIYSNPGCSQDEAASALRIDKTTVAKALATLESKKCIERTQDTQDRRKKRIVITETGNEKIADLMNIHNEWLEKILSCLSADEQLKFEDCCERLLCAAEALAVQNQSGGKKHE